MKKIFLVLSFIFIILLTGCSKEEYFTCTINLDNEIDQYHLDAVYKVYYKDSLVTKVEKEEIYTTTNEDTLEYFNKYKNLEYKNINDLYGGTTYNVDLKDETVTINATIDVSATDIKKMVKNNYIDSNYVVSNRLTVGGIKLFYESKGANCDI